MRRASFASFVLVAALALGACGSGSPKAQSPPTSVVKLSSPSYEKAKPYPSKSAKMICQTEVRGEIQDALGVAETRVVPAWNQQRHLYTCTYVYPRGKIVLSVKEMSSERETTTYYDAVREKFGAKNTIPGVGQGAWRLKNDDVVVRKDYKVLLVNVQGIPADFVHGLNRAGVATAIAGTIMVCWTGA